MRCGGCGGWGLLTIRIRQPSAISDPSLRPWVAITARSIAAFLPWSGRLSSTPGRLVSDFAQLYLTRDSRDRDRSNSVSGRDFELQGHSCSDQRLLRRQPTQVLQSLLDTSN